MRTLQGLGWRDYPGLPTTAAMARNFIGCIAVGRADTIIEDARLVTDELVANAVVHTASGRPGGVLRLAYSLYDAGLWVAIADQGAAGSPHICRQADDECTSGRGLLLIAALATRWDIIGDATGRLVWCQLGITPTLDFGHLSQLIGGHPRALFAPQGLGLDATD